MGIALVADIPNQPRSGCVKHGMQGDAELYHTQTRAQMTTGFGDNANRLAAHFIGQNPQG